MADKDKKAKKGPAENTREKRQHGWMELLSIFNKEGDELAQWIGRTVPQDSPLRGPIFARFFGPASAWIESQADNVSSPFISAAIEKFSDLLQGIEGELIRGRKKGAEATTGGEKAESKAPTDWIVKFQKEAAERLQKAAESGKESEEFELLQRQFKARKDLFEWIVQQTNPATANDRPIVEKTTLVEELKKLKSEFGPPVVQAAKGLDDAAEKLAVHVDRLNDWLGAGKKNRDSGSSKSDGNAEDQGQKPRSGGGLAAMVMRLRGVR